MRYLIDSNIFIFLVLDPSKLSDAARAILLAPTNELLLSVASVWELQIKILKGKLQIGRPLQDAMREQWEINGVKLLAIQPEHIFALESLPKEHADPFDRLIIAQAKFENIPIVTSDMQFSRYGVNVVW